MLTCCCSLAGTKACESCGVRYQEKQTMNHSQGVKQIVTPETKPQIKKVRETIEEFDGVGRTVRKTVIEKEF